MSDTTTQEPVVEAGKQEQLAEEVAKLEETNQAGLVPGKILLTPFYHPLTKYILLPSRTILTLDMIEAIQLMRAERQALICIGEPPDKQEPEVDTLEEAPRLMRQIESDAQFVAYAGDVLILLLAASAMLAFWVQSWLILAFIGLLLAAWIGLVITSQSFRQRAEVVRRTVDIERARRSSGVAKLKGIIGSGIEYAGTPTFRAVPLRRGERTVAMAGYSLI
ncbi:MAG: hypothetical protein HY692_01925 [Cyanobacteria bacterium NC_groundwater_1444_Ag_S-0.65um_54_12]|nr:hypothetical protein [Cyanobacteria bacterium NC_groundwater_1444_Ag_S-0.65um_54_12]